MYVEVIAMRGSQIAREIAMEEKAKKRALHMRWKMLKDIKRMRGESNGYRKTESLQDSRTDAGEDR